MSIHDDARRGTLTGDILTRYIKSNPNILYEQDPATGYAPLTTAAVAGHADVVDQLLRKGAQAEAVSRGGETALLLATRQTPDNLPRIVQLLLSKTPARLVDATTAAQSNDTPLMFAVRRKDVESIRLLVNAGASPQARNNRGDTPESVATADPDKAIKRALDPAGEQEMLARLADFVGDFISYIIAWINETAEGIMNRLFGLKPKSRDVFDPLVNAPEKETPDPTGFADNINTFLAKEENAALGRFFKKEPDYLQKLARNVADLANDPDTALGQKELLPKVVEVSLHRQVIYCDDSGSMRFSNRWAAQAMLVKRIARITTRILPPGEGVALRFINQTPAKSDDLNLQEISDVMESMSYDRKGDTPIGTNLRSKILEPLIYSQLENKTLTRPYLISIMTDGDPQGGRETKETLIETIKECSVKLQQAGYPVETVKFLIGQIGTARPATEFLKRMKDVVDSVKELQAMVHVLSDQLDKSFSDLKDNEKELDAWLIKTLYKPLENAANLKPE